MASIEKRQTKQGIKYRVRITLKGHPRVSETFTTRREAKRWAERTTEAIRQRRYQPEAEAEQHTLSDLIDRYIEVKVPQLARAKDTARNLEWWRKVLGADTRLSQITPAIIAEARDKLISGKGISGKPLAPATVHRYITILSGAFSAGTKEWFWMDDNPALRVVKPAQGRGRARFLDEDEKPRLLAACKDSHEPRLYPLVAMALCTGARRGELLNLTWKDVDLDRGAALIHHSKNGDRRSLTISGLAEKVLADWRAQRRLGTDLVFPSRTNSTAFPQNQWMDAVEAAGLVDFHFHDCRHREAVEGPARLYGRRIAPQLVNRLLNDAGGESDLLPVLQHALLRLWELAQGNEVLDLRHYERIGTLEGALAGHAEEALAEVDDPRSARFSRSVIRQASFQRSIWSRSSPWARAFASADPRPTRSRPSEKGGKLRFSEEI